MDFTSLDFGGPKDQFQKERQRRTAYDAPARTYMTEKSESNPRERVLRELEIERKRIQEKIIQVRRLLRATVLRRRGLRRARSCHRENSVSAKSD
jgi:hypothetical protein